MPALSAGQPCARLGCRWRRRGRSRASLAARVLEVVDDEAEHAFSRSELVRSGATPTPRPAARRRPVRPVSGGKGFLARHGATLEQSARFRRLSLGASCSAATDDVASNPICTSRSTSDRLSPPPPPPPPPTPADGAPPPTTATAGGGAASHRPGAAAPAPPPAACAQRPVGRGSLPLPPRTRREGARSRHRRGDSRSSTCEADRVTPPADLLQRRDRALAVEALLDELDDGALDLVVRRGARQLEALLP